MICVISKPPSKHYINHALRRKICDYDFSSVLTTHAKLDCVQSPFTKKRFILENFIRLIINIFDT